MHNFLLLIGILLKTPRALARGVLLGLMAVSLIIIIHPVLAVSVADLREEMDQALSGIDQEIAQLNKEIEGLQKQQKTLAREIKLLDTEVRKVELEIKRLEAAIVNNQEAIVRKEAEIAVHENNLRRERSILAQTIVAVDQNDKESIVEILLSAEDFSDVFGKISNIESIEKKIHEQIAEIKKIKAVLDEQKIVLDGKKEELISLQTLAVLERAKIEEKKQYKVELLTVTRGRERLFNERIVQAKQNASVLRQQIFLLEGSGVSMPFEEALQLAKKASSYANVRPAFLLAILKKESHWGASVGTGNWRDDMHPRDQGPFYEITLELGLDPDMTPVSRKPSYGWGGAMGPAQFLPGTWLGWKDKVAEVTGHNPPSPWNLEDAFTASALKLAAAGADQKNTDAEWKAAMIYFAGRNWDNPLYAFYGNDIIALTELLQEQINLIDGPSQ